jgi:hypothetical protein
MAPRSKWTASKSKSNEQYIQGDSTSALDVLNCQENRPESTRQIFGDDWQQRIHWLCYMALFVPKAWNWYSYIHAKATELIVAVRAINVFFSFSLVSFGILDMLFVHGSTANRYSIIVMLAPTCVLWLTRLMFQLIYPQGSINPILQYGMLSAFIIINLCYMISLK